MRGSKQKGGNGDERYSPYDIQIGKNVKYITLKDGSEYFYTGGKYIRMGDNKIVIKSGPSIDYVPLTFQNQDGTIIYRTRLFVENEKEVCDEKQKEEYEKIIHTQQQIIEKMNVQLKKQTQIINKLSS